MTKVIDTANLPTEEVNQLRQLINVANFFHLPATIKTQSPQPDRFVYHITVEENSRQHTLTVGEQAVPSSLRPLIDWLIAAPRQ